MEQSIARLDDCKRLCRLPEALWRELDLGAVVLNENTGSAFTLNQGALQLWKALDGKRTVKELAERATRGAGAVDELSDAITKALEQFVEAGLIGECGDGATNKNLDDFEPAQPIEQLPEISEIAFGVCDCTGSPLGLMRNDQCATVGQALAVHSVVS